MGGGLVRPCENTFICTSLGRMQSHSSFRFDDLRDADRVVTPIVGIDVRLLFCRPAELFFFLLLSCGSVFGSNINGREAAVAQRDIMVSRLLDERLSLPPPSSDKWEERDEDGRSPLSSKSYLLISEFFIDAAMAFCSCTTPCIALERYYGV